ncbi:MAG: DUF3280 domain-containing protein [Hyphomicrobiaceae bacterium]
MLLASGSHALADARSLLVFPFEMIDAAQDPMAMGLPGFGGLPKGPDSAETARLTAITSELERRIAADGRYRLADRTGIAAELADRAPISKCNGCEDDLASKAGAELALVATVEKLSDLLFNFNLYLRDVKAQKLVSVMSTTVQGSTDEAWQRGIRYLAERKLLTAGDQK